MNEIAEVKGSPLGSVELNRSFPIYVWRTGTTYFLSKTEKIVADTFIATRNLSECARVLLSEGIRKSKSSCKRMLEEDHVKDYLKEQFEERGVGSGWTQEHWLKVMSDHVTGVKRLKVGDLYAMKLIGDHKGFFEGVKGINIVNQINFTQSDGTR